MASKLSSTSSSSRVSNSIAAHAVDHIIVFQTIAITGDCNMQTGRKNIDLSEKPLIFTSFRAVSDPFAAVMRLILGIQTKGRMQAAHRKLGIFRGNQHRNLDFRR